MLRTAENRQSFVMCCRMQNSRAAVSAFDRIFVRLAQV